MGQAKRHRKKKGEGSAVLRDRRIKQEHPRRVGEQAGQEGQNQSLVLRHSPNNAGGGDLRCCSL